MPRIYKKIDLVGLKFGRLTVLSFSHSAKKYKTFWNVRCDCGKELIARGDGLKDGNTTSCGCYKLELLLKSATKHGLSAIPEYRSWADMKCRCTSVSDTVKKTHYFDRGIVVCDGYKNSFKLFFTDIGKKPTKSHSVDRIDNDKNYSFGKCNECILNEWKFNIQWATAKEQNRNKRTNKWHECDGIKMILKDWSIKLNVSKGKLRYFLLSHSIEDAIKYYQK